MRAALAALLLCVPALASADTYIFAGGAFTRIVDGDDTATVPNVVGEADAAAADLVLEGDGLDLGTEVMVCSAAAANEIIGQAPSAGTIVALGSLVDVTSSSGVECNGRPGLWLQAPGPGLRGMMEIEDEE